MSASGYTRQSSATIASGQPLASAPVNNEFNQLQSAFSGTSGHDHSGGSGLGPNLLSTAIGINATSVGLTALSGAGAFVNRTITGTALQIDVANGAGTSGNPTISIDAGYPGQTSIVTVGTLTNGSWNASIIGSTYGGTGVNNGGNTITIAGNLTTASSFTTSGANSLTLTTTAPTNVTLPASGTLVPTTVTSLTALNTVGIIGTGTWQGTIVAPTYGGTGINNGSNTISVAGSFVTSGANSLTLTTTGGTNVTLPTSGTLVNTAVVTLSSLTSASALATVGTIATGTWQGTAIALAYGGTNASLTASNGGVFYSTSTAAAILSGTATSNQILLSGSNAAPAWSTATYPATTTANQILYSNANNTVSGLSTANSSLLVTGSSGIPALSTTIPNGVIATTQSAGDSSTKIATTAFVNSTALTLASGTTAVTQSVGNATTNVATTKFANPATSLATSGYVQFPGGAVLQWGTASTSGGSGAITFPVAFPAACTAVTLTNTQSSSTSTYGPSASGFSTTGCNIYNQGGVSLSYTYMATGY